MGELFILQLLMSKGPFLGPFLLLSLSSGSLTFPWTHNPIFSQHGGSSVRALSLTHPLAISRPNTPGQKVRPV